ncbi:hypothetical protein PCL_04789 [Purpureocillium lilacinum]|uniref:Uncharacterized protein n=1 Tax=Purpureocillium lilacinum TaxID=33203 RepID=A0A2U3DWK9_PURLI|nr:hypothetical protein PCL_04789 [Purpureocillium lilacinum]
MRWARPRWAVGTKHHGRRDCFALPPKLPSADQEDAASGFALRLPVVAIVDNCPRTSITLHPPPLSAAPRRPVKAMQEHACPKLTLFGVICSHSCMLACFALPRVAWPYLTLPYCILHTGAILRTGQAHGDTRRAGRRSTSRAPVPLISPRTNSPRSRHARVCPCVTRASMALYVIRQNAKYFRMDTSVKDPRLQADHQPRPSLKSARKPASHRSPTLHMASPLSPNAPERTQPCLPHSGLVRAPAPELPTTEVDVSLALALARRAPIRPSAVAGKR